MHPTKSVNPLMVKNWPTIKGTVFSGLFLFFIYVVTVVFKATNWCTGSLSLWSKNIEDVTSVVFRVKVIDIDLSFYIYIFCLYAGLGSEGVQYLVSQVSFL